MVLINKEIHSKNNLSIVVCTHSRGDVVEKSCAGSGSQQLIEQLRMELLNRKLDIFVREQVCFGRCNEGIVMRIAPGKDFFTQVDETMLPEIVGLAEKYLIQSQMLE